MPGRILIVEDSAKTAEVLGRSLERSGREIKIAYDGLQALETAEQFLPDVIIIDINLPKLNGCEVAQRIRQQPWSNQITLIAITGWMSEEERLVAREAGFNAVLLKPFNNGDLSTLIAECYRANTSTR